MERGREMKTALEVQHGTEEGRREALFSEICILKCKPQQNSLGSVWQVGLYIFLSIMSFQRVERLKDFP